MANIYNLSYDISAKLADENHVPNEQRIDRNRFVDKLCKDGIISLTDAFVIEGEPEENNHIILRPVETTIMFYSTLSLDELNNYLSQYTNQLYYIITGVRDDAIKGYSHIDYTHQDLCDETIKDFVKDFVKGIVKHVIFKLKSM